MTSINIDWSDSNGLDIWENCGERVLRQILDDADHEDFKRVAEELEIWDEEESCLIDSYEEQINSWSDPMMNYGHILETTPKDEDILKVVLGTNCSVMYNNEEDKYYIVLCGGGMDLSQDIALSFVWLEKWIPEDFIGSVCKQRGLSKGGKEFDEIRSAIIEQCETYMNRLNNLRADWGAIPPQE